MGSPGWLGKQRYERRFLLKMPQETYDVLKAQANELLVPVSHYIRAILIQVAHPRRSAKTDITILMSRDSVTSLLPKRRR